MKRALKIVSLVYIIIISNVYSQEVKGVVSYRGVINERYVDSFLTALESKKEIAMHIKQVVVDGYVNATPDEYTLNFIGKESYCFINPKLSKSSFDVGSKAGVNPYYVNGDSIIMESSLGYILQKPIKWKITQETKKIGKYVCYKAIASEKLFSRQGYYYSKQVIAWFTPEIPVNFGPLNYNGLPGLILQIERDMFTLTATKVNLNPDEKDIKIKRLDKNTHIISEEVANNRIKEMMEYRKKEYKGQ